MNLDNSIMDHGDHAQQRQSHKKALRYLSLTVFVLFSVPRARILLGPIPLYLIDGLTLLTIHYAIQLYDDKRPPLRPLVLLILAAAFISELLAGLRIGTLLEPLYLIARTFVAASLFFIIPRIVQTQSHLEALLKAALLGVLITAALMVLTSLPQTRSQVIETVFSLPFLEPAYEGIATVYDYRALAAGRGRSLVGVSILSAAFLNSILPLLFLLRTRQGLKWTIALALAAVLVPTAVVMSYSRGAIIGLLLLIITVVFLNSPRIRRPLVLGVGVALMLFFWIGWESEHFYFERLEITTQNALANPQDNISLTERLNAYPEPFQHLVQNPEFLFVGQGFARRNVAGHNLSAGADAATHAVFATAYYGYGMLAAFAYFGLLLGAFGMTWQHVRRSQNDFSSAYSRALLASMMGFLSWFMFGHAGVSEPRGAMLLFLLFGLVAAQSNFALLSEPEPVNHALSFSERLKLRYGVIGPSSERIL